MYVLDLSPLDAAESFASRHLYELVWEYTLVLSTAAGWKYEEKLVEMVEKAMEGHIHPMYAERMIDDYHPPFWSIQPNPLVHWVLEEEQHLRWLTMLTRHLEVRYLHEFGPHPVADVARQCANTLTWRLPVTYETSSAFEYPHLLYCGYTFEELLPYHRTEYITACGGVYDPCSEDEPAWWSRQLGLPGILPVQSEHEPSVPRR